MKSILTSLVIGLFLFAVSAGVSYLYIFPPETPTEEELAEELSEDHEFPAKVADADLIEEMPVSHRPETPVTVEAVTELAQSIMKKEKALFDSEQRLKKEEKRIGLLFEDLRRERDELTAFGQKIDAKIEQAREALKLLKLERQSVDNQVGVLSKLEKKTGKTTEDVEDDEFDRRVKVVRDWFRDLDEVQAANYIREIANRGDMDFASRLLDSLEDRQVSKVLEEFNDAPLVAEIIDAITKKKTDSTSGIRIR